MRCHAIFLSCVLVLLPLLLLLSLTIHHETLIYATANLFARVFTGYVSCRQVEVTDRTEDFSNVCCSGLEYFKLLF